MGSPSVSSGVWCRWYPNASSQNDWYSRVMRMNSCQATSTAREGIPRVFPSA
jgi:hypothetical protein